MRNKKRLGYAAVLGLAVPFMVFTMVFAEYSATEPSTDADLQKIGEEDRAYKVRAAEQETAGLKAREALKSRLEADNLKLQEASEGIKVRTGERADKLGEVVE